MCTQQVAGQMSVWGTADAALLNTAGSFANALSDQRTDRANAQTFELASKDALERGAAETNKVQQRTAQIVGNERASYGAGNVALDEGSPVNVITGTQYQGAVDEKTATENAQRESQGYLTRAANYRAAASGVSPFLSTLSPLIAGATSVASKWYDYKQKGSGGYVQGG